MTPFYFGEGERRLLGVYDPAEGGRPGTSRAVLFCAPWGPEYVLSHPALRRLALSLSAAGWHVLRFDYFGVGDSAGEIEDGDLPGWLGDIEMAIEELQSMVGCHRVSLVGLRLGATLAATVASRRNDIDKLVLWDPIVSGTAYLEELDAGHAAFVSGRTRYVRLPSTDVPNRLCHPLPAEVERQMAAIDLTKLSAKLKQNVLLMLREEGDSAHRARSAFAQQDPGRLTIETTADQPFWISSRLDFGGSIPAIALKKVAAWME